MTACAHLAEFADADPPAKTPGGCEECLAIGSPWVHLRKCLACGHIGCCDSSQLKHARAHFRAEQHPVVISYQPGESWRWCYDDEVGT